MKLKITFLLIAFLSTISIAQTKVGTIDSEYIIQLMPENQIVLKRTKDYGVKLDSSFSKKIKSYRTKVEAFKKVEKTIQALAKKASIKELGEMETEIKQYQQNGTKLMQLKRDELMRPLYKKLGEAIQEIAKENNYTQILTITGNQFAYIDQKFDVTNMILIKLGIAIPKKDN